MSASDREAFICPACGEQIDVSQTMRTAVLKNGCPFCTDTVEEGNFV